PRTRVGIDRVCNRLLPAAAHYAIARVVAERVADRDGVPAAQIDVIPIGKDVTVWQRRGGRDATRRRLGIPGGAPTAGWSGRIHPVKELPVLFRAVGSLPGWWLVVVGDGEDRSRLEGWATTTGLHPRFVATGE